MTANSQERQELVLQVEGLTCPIVEGLGCGGLLKPVLARLDAVEGVERSFANRSGNMIRLSLKPIADVEKVSADAAQVLTEEGAYVASRLSGESVIAASKGEEWRDVSRIDELTGIEIRTVLLRFGAIAAVGGAFLGTAVYWWRRRKRTQQRA